MAAVTCACPQFNQYQTSSNGVTDRSRPPRLLASSPILSCSDRNNTGSVSLPNTGRRTESTIRNRCRRRWRINGRARICYHSTLSVTAAKDGGGGSRALLGVYRRAAEKELDSEAPRKGRDEVPAACLLGPGECLASPLEE